MTVDSTPQRRGRPRDADAERRILDATIDVLISSGYANLSIEAVAAQADVGKPTIYRRWPTKLDLVVAAVEHNGNEPEGRETDDPKADIEHYVTALIGGLAASPLAYALLAVSADPARHKELVDRLTASYIAPRQQMIIMALERAKAMNLVRGDVDAELVVELVIGPPLYHWLSTGEHVSSERAHILFGLAWNAIANPPSP